MDVILVTLSSILSKVFTQVLSPEIEYCAIVVDEPEPAKKIIAEYGGSPNMVYPFYDFKECIENTAFDYIVCVSNSSTVNLLPQQVYKYGAPKNKTVQFYLTTDGNHSHIIKRTLSYFKKHYAEFEMFATGMSYTSVGLDSTKFKRKLFNFAKASQDLYYDYQIAKFAISASQRGKICYALIGLAPYTFHYDLSKTLNENWRLIHYLVALNDLHNFHLPAEKCRKLFRESFLAAELDIEKLNLNNVNLDKVEMANLDFKDRLTTRDRAEVWSKESRTFLETRDENIKILNDYLTLCEKNNIRPIIFLPPMCEGYKKYFSKEKLDEFYQILEDAMKKFPDAIFVDGWKISQFTDEDFFDPDHLNLAGAEKFSEILNNIIVQAAKT